MTSTMKFVPCTDPPQETLMLPLASTAETVVVASKSPVLAQLIVLVPGLGTAAEYAARKPAPTVSATVRVNIAAVAPLGTATVGVLPTKPFTRLTVRVCTPGRRPWPLAAGPVPERESYTRTGDGSTWRLPAVDRPDSWRHAAAEPAVESVTQY